LENSSQNFASLPLNQHPSFNHLPQDFGAVGISLHPTKLLFAYGVLEEHIAQGWQIEMGGRQLTTAEIQEVTRNLSRSWDLKPLEDPSSPSRPPNRWIIQEEAADVDAEPFGEIVLRTAKLSLNSPYLNSVIAVDPDNIRSPIKSWFNKGEAPFMVSFQDPAYIYYDGQLFYDHRLLSSSEGIAGILDGRLPNNTKGEKTLAGQEFDPLSLFGLTEQLYADSDFILCDDYGTEWADYVTIKSSQLAFFHCKSTTTAVGASGLHEVVSQAIKNLGLLSAEISELYQRKARWEGTWTNTKIPRLRKGKSVEDFINAFTKAASAPNYRPRVVLVVSGLSKKAITEAFLNLRLGSVTSPHISQLLWILSFFVDNCRTAGADAHVICEA
jgi:hypothetical protein